MSGHSKWSSIKHQKASADAKRGNLFTKLANAISIAARAGGDKSMNFQLRLALERARAANMPKDNIERAIKRGTGELGGTKIEEVLYEIYGPAGSAILVEALTDNKNRTSAEIKAVLNKFGGKIAGGGAVSYLFERKGEIKMEPEGKNAEEAELAIIDSGAEDYEKIDDGFLIYTRPEELKSVSDALTKAGYRVASGELIWNPKNTVSLPKEDSEKVIKLLEALNDLDSISNVNSNLG